jgi:hypothetical protein
MRTVSLCNSLVTLTYLMAQVKLMAKETLRKSVQEGSGGKNDGTEQHQISR